MTVPIPYVYTCGDNVHGHSYGYLIIIIRNNLAVYYGSANIGIGYRLFLFISKRAVTFLSSSHRMNEESEWTSERTALHQSPVHSRHENCVLWCARPVKETQYSIVYVLGRGWGDGGKVAFRLSLVRGPCRDFSRGCVCTCVFLLVQGRGQDFPFVGARLHNTHAPTPV